VPIKKKSISTYWGGEEEGLRVNEGVPSR